MNCGLIKGATVPRRGRHGHVDATSIRVEVHDGEITLEGTVASRRKKRLAENAVEAIPGVHNVHNGLRVDDSRVE